MTFTNTHSGLTTEEVEVSTVNQLAELIFDLNRLAKRPEHSGSQRTLYRLKARACGIALQTGGAAVNNVSANGCFVGLSVSSVPPYKVHIRVSDLGPEAQRIVRRQAASVPVVARMSDFMPCKP